MLINHPFDLQVTQTGPDPISLEEIKIHARITFYDDDSYLESLIPLAKGMLEDLTGLLLAESTINASYANIERLGWCLIPYSNQSEVKLGSATAGAELATYPNKDYSLYQSPSGGNFAITYKAGKCPSSAKLALLLLVTHLYENRSATTDVSISEMPISFHAIIEKLRIKAI